MAKKNFVAIKMAKENTNNNLKTFNGVKKTWVLGTYYFIGEIRWINELIVAMFYFENNQLLKCNTIIVS